MNLTGILYRAARASATARAVRRSIETGSPAPVLRRAKNKAVGRALSKAGVWRRLWK
ncbi:MAG: hypothetical protein ACREQ5_22235 [Candidatus Dormibacteria bacterium]